MAIFIGKFRDFKREYSSDLQTKESQPSREVKKEGTEKGLFACFRKVSHSQLIEITATQK